MTRPSRIESVTCPSGYKATTLLLHYKARPPSIPINITTKFGLKTYKAHMQLIHIQKPSLERLVTKEFHQGIYINFLSKGLTN